MPEPLVTVAIPSLNQGRFLEQTLESLFSQSIPVEVFVLDAGSEDGSVETIRRWERHLAGWRSHPDQGQAAAINEGISQGVAPYVCWLNSDDFLYPGGLRALFETLQSNPGRPFVYGRCWTVSAAGRKLAPYLTLPFSARTLANFCFVAQPGTLIPRAAWADVGGLREDLHMAFDYELWWRLYRSGGEPAYCRKFVAATRWHRTTKTAVEPERHYRESMQAVRAHWGKIPVKWRLGLPVVKALRKLLG